MIITVIRYSKQVLLTERKNRERIEIGSEEEIFWKGLVCRLDDESYTNGMYV